jgi:nucleoid-associated protein YgaU
MINSRYNNRQKFKNNHENFSEHLKVRDVKHISHYVTPQLPSVDSETFSKLQIQTHIWKAGDRLYKLANEYYNDPTLWWIIAWFNKKPTESHFEVGQIVLIPKPLNKIMNLLGI